MQARQSGGKAHGKTNKAGGQAGKEIRKQRQARKVWRERQGRADKLARKGRHERRIQYVCKANGEGEARRQGPKSKAGR
jgi:hypothetical protein